MQAVVVDPEATARLTLGEVAEPTPGPHEAVIEVAAISLNLGETRGSQRAEAGWRPGWDLAGTVQQAAADGNGPGAGERVVGFLRSGAWAERVAVPTDALAALPTAVSFATASTLPVAGLTALYSLDRCRALLGKRALITGASGGVGHLGCQLARKAGAHVVASVRRPERAAIVREAGAHEVVVGEDLSVAAPLGPYDLILEAVGAVSLSTALGLLALDGVCVLYGVSAGHETTFDAGSFMTAGGSTLYGFILFHELLTQPASGGLTRLVAMVANGSLRPQIEVEEPWSQIGAVAQRLLDRHIGGKAVLHVQS